MAFHGMDEKTTSQDVIVASGAPNMRDFNIAPADSNIKKGTKEKGDQSLNENWMDDKSSVIHGRSISQSSL
jgi:hypothetical protein